MKLLLLNTLENVGGAAMATNRLHHGMRAIGVDTHLLVQSKQTDDDSVSGPPNKLHKVISQLRQKLDGLPLMLYQQHEKVIFSPACIPDGLVSRVRKFEPDIVHLFWVTGGFMRIETLKKFKRPIVWTLHDMWPFTGGCHYDNGCGKFEKVCGNCPVLHSGREHDLSNITMLRKIKSWENTQIVVVATSFWIAEMARASAVFKHKRIEVIPNGLDLEKYKPVDKYLARTAFNLPHNKNLIFFSAFSGISDRRKGNQFLINAIEKLIQDNEGLDLEIVILGTSKPQNIPEFTIRAHYMGHLRDEISQVLLYSAVDVLVAPSIQENLSNTVLESLACGTPVVAFDIGGMPDMIKHKENGYLAKPFESSDLATGIMWVLENRARYKQISNNARETVLAKYDVKVVAEQYAALYRDILNSAS